VHLYRVTTQIAAKPINWSQKIQFLKRIAAMCVSAESKSPAEKTWRFFTEKDLHQGIANSTIVLILGFPFIGDNLMSSRDR
jgi:hypothetical protein